jgi:hypothetical protein
MRSKLSELAATIVDELPTLLERPLRHEIENSILFDQCVELKNRIDLIKDSIELERDKQKQLRTQIARIMGPAPSKSDSIREREFQMRSLDPRVAFTSGQSVPRLVLGILTLISRSLLKTKTYVYLRTQPFAFAFQLFTILICRRNYH